MHCPNCAQPGLRTIETFQLGNETIRTKKCPLCKWTFTSREEICDSVVIPKAIRHTKRKKVENTQGNG